jgi:oxygen-independent coproporphyrinogen III oxidase
MLRFVPGGIMSSTRWYAGRARDRGEIVSENLPLNPDLLRRYDRPGPRYTSYPAAPHFSPAFGAAEFQRFAIKTGEAVPLRPLSLYVHIPFCHSPCLYCGCNRVITRSTHRAAAYVARLLREMEVVAPLFGHRDVRQLHFGGGTPNFLTPAQLGEIMESLQRHFGFSSRGDREFSIEMDPRFARPEDFEPLAWLGINRVSFGVQDFDTEVQLAVNRVQSCEQTLTAIDACRTAGIASINVDLMYGLPRQSPTSFRRTLRTVIEARPSRLAVYGYAHLPALFKAQRRIHSDELPDPQTRVKLLSMAIDMLQAAGYRHIGMDHFALPEDELVRAQGTGTLQRNFMGYTTHADCDLLGFGVSSISHVGNSYSQNPRDLEAWEAAIDAGHLPVWRGLELDDDDIIRADIINRIMCLGDVDITAIENRYGIDFWTYFSAAHEQLTKLEADGLVWTCASRIVASSQGRYLLRVIAACFDRHLAAQSNRAPTAVRFSQAV